MRGFSLFPVYGRHLWSCQVHVSAVACLQTDDAYDRSISTVLVGRIVMWNMSATIYIYQAVV